MAGFDIGKFAGGLLGSGIQKGAEAGIRYLAQDARMTVWATRTHNTEALEALAHVQALWLQEAVDESNNPLKTALAAVIENSVGLGHDPFADSRHALQDVYAKYGAECDAWWKTQTK